MFSLSFKNEEISTKDHVNLKQAHQVKVLDFDGALTPMYYYCKQFAIIPSSIRVCKNIIFPNKCYQNIRIQDYNHTPKK